MASGPGQIPGALGGVNDSSNLGGASRQSEVLDRAIFKDVANKVGTAHFEPKLLFEAFDRVKSDSVRIDFLDLIAKKLEPAQVRRNATEVLSIINGELAGLESGRQAPAGLVTSLAGLIIALGASIPHSGLEWHDFQQLINIYRQSQYSDPILTGAFNKAAHAQSQVPSVRGGPEAVINPFVDEHGFVHSSNEGAAYLPEEAISQSEGAARDSDIGITSSVKSVMKGAARVSDASRGVLRGDQVQRHLSAERAADEARPDFRFVEGENGAQRFVDPSGLTVRTAEGIREVGVEIPLFDGRQATNYAYVFGGREMGIIGIFAQLGGVAAAVVYGPDG